MPHSFEQIGSMGHLHVNQCLDDIWLNPGNPNAPIQGDRRLMTQAAANQWGYLYLEEWHVGLNAWEVIPMLANIQLLDTTINPIVQPTIALNPAQIENQVQMPNVPLTGYHILNGLDYSLSDLNGGVLWYIQHRQRRRTAQNPNRLIPLRASQPRVIRRLVWGVQANLWRGRYF